MTIVSDNVVAIAQHYQALPLTLTPERYEIASRMLREICKFESLFTDYERTRCEAVCFECADCLARKQTVVRMLLDPYARVWEVWTTSYDPQLVGILYLSHIIPGNDALAHYVFFDNNLRDKTELLEEMIQWCFEAHEGWLPLRRLTVEIPTYAHALARHATHALGFGGNFFYESKRKAIPVEGIRRNAIVWRNSPHDILILGRLRDG